MRPDRPLLGIALMLGFCVTAPLIDVTSKLAAGAGLPVGQITAGRFVVQAAVMLPVVLILGQPLAVAPQLLPGLFLRGLLLMLSTFAFVSAVAVMPIADALAIVFVEPFIILLYGRFVLAEPVGPRRLAASLVGFAGVLMVIQPSFQRFGAVALWPLGTAVTFAFYMLVTRGLAARLHPVPMQFHTSWLALLAALPVVALAEGSGIAALDPVWPHGLGWLWLAGVGVTSALSHLLMTYALRAASSSVLAPLHYLELVSAVVLGYAIWGDFPNPLAWAGIAIVCGSGLYVIHRERLAARSESVTLAPGAPDPHG